VRTDVLTAPAARGASPSLTDVYGFTLWRAPGSTVAFPVEALVDYEGGRSESIIARAGVCYSSGTRMLRVWFVAAGAGGLYVDVARHPADLVTSAAPELLVEEREVNVYGQGAAFSNLATGYNAMGVLYSACYPQPKVLRPPRWARALDLTCEARASGFSGGALSFMVWLIDAVTGEARGQLDNSKALVFANGPNAAIATRLAFLGAGGNTTQGGAASSYDASPSAPLVYGLALELYAGGVGTLQGDGGLRFVARYWGAP